MDWIQKNWVNILLVIAVFILYMFLFGDLLEVSGDYGADSKVELYSLAATFVTVYLWRRRNL